MVAPSRSPFTLAPLVAVALAGAPLAGCGGGAPAPASPPPARPKPSAAAEYLAPPAPLAARRAGTGLTLAGGAPAGARVRLVSPAGQTASVTAGPDGRWSVSLPSPARPGLFALSAVASGRLVRAEGVVLVLPPPGPAAVLARAGYAVLPLEVGARQPAIASLDYDAGGGGAVGGLAGPKARVRLSLDGAAVGQTQADELGRFAVIAANRPLRPGERRLQVETETGQAEVTALVSPAAPLGGETYRAMRQPGAWRVDWSPAGGGVQTTVVFDRPAPSRPPARAGAPP